MEDPAVSDGLFEALHQLTTLLESDEALEKTLDTVVALSVAALPGCDSAGVTIGFDGEHFTAASSDGYTLEIDKIQYDSGQGPCVTATRESEIQQIEIISEESRWPDFCRAAESRGVRSVLSFPLRSDSAVGSLNLYATTERAFDETAVGLGQIFARQAVVALQNSHAYLTARRLADQLAEAVRTRDVIGQAKGIIMEREKVSGDDAFEMLKRISQRSNVKLRDVAERLIQETPR